jgi:hypothetical protein
MKPVTADEMQKLVLDLQASVGHRLQEVRLFKTWIALGFYSHYLYWLIVDLNPVSPQLVGLSDLKRIPFQDERKPVQLYMKAHFIGERLMSVEAPPESGRVLYLRFSEKKVLEIRLFPRGQNFLVHSDNATIAFSKPQPLKNVNEVNNSLPDNFQSNNFLNQRSQEWLEFIQLKKSPKGKNPTSGENENAIQNFTSKIQKAIEKIKEDIAKKQNENWQGAGEWIKANQSLSVPDEFLIYIDLKKSIAENMSACFQKSKEFKSKIGKAQSRIKELETQLKNPITKTPPQDGKNKNSQLFDAKAKGRTIELSNELTLYMGKSAEDNIRLLRQAKPWFYWLHLRDEPSTHGIIQRNKNQAVSESILHLAARHLIAKTFGEKEREHYGEKFTVILAECRFVRPIKGDKVGHVQYSNERTFNHLFLAPK